MLYRILKTILVICLMFLLLKSIKDMFSVFKEENVISVVSYVYLKHLAGSCLESKKKNVILISCLVYFWLISVICLSLKSENTDIINEFYRTKSRNFSFLEDRKWNANNIATTVSERLAKYKHSSYRHHLFALTRISKQTCWAFPSSLKGYFRELENNRSRSGLMKYEWARYETFKTFPFDSPVMPLRLASNGFYFNGSEDSVTCFSCGLEYRGWKEGDSVANIHAHFSPNCKFIRGADQTNIGIHADEVLGATGGVSNEVDSSFRSGEVCVQKHSRLPVESDTSTRTMHKYPDYENYHTRMDTFIGWPCGDIIQPEILGSAGFFYAGFSDCVRCFSCGGGLRNWEYGDGPWEEHARWFPGCVFLREQKGPDFIRQHREAHADSGDDQESSSTAIVSGQEALNTVRSKTGSEKPRPTDILSTVKTNNDESNSTTEALSTEKSILAKQFIQQALLPMGFSLADIQKSLQRTAIIDSTESAVARVLDDLVENSQSNDKEHKTEHSENNTSAFDRKLTGYREEATANGAVKISAEMDQKTLQEENSRLIDQLTCKICMVKESNVVFIPCGHMVSCETCAPHIRKCAICRQPIKGRVKAFMS